MLDTDNDGQLTGEDLKRGVSLFGNILQKKNSHHNLLIYLIYIGNSVTETDVEEMMASADVDGDGLINYEEFLKVMVSSNFFSYPLDPSHCVYACVDTFQGQRPILVLNSI